MKIAIVTDGNLTLGLGHVYQSLTLARLLRDRGNTEIRFYTKSDEYVCKFIRDEGFHVDPCENDDSVFLKLKEFKAVRIIFDKIDVSPLLAKRIKSELSSKLIIFTNLTTANEDADVTVLADVNYKNLVYRTDGRVSFLGPKFWVLREDFYHFKHKIRVQKHQIDRVMIMFGGADPENLSHRVLKELLGSDLSLSIVVVLGKAYAFESDLKNLLFQVGVSKHNVQIRRNVTNVAELMFENDLIFTSPGLSFFEALIVGTPVVCFHQNEQQRNEFLNLFPTLGVDDVPRVPQIIEDRLFLFPNDMRVKDMKIGEGLDEILREILS